MRKKLHSRNKLISIEVLLSYLDGLYFNGQKPNITGSKSNTENSTST